MLVFALVATCEDGTSPDYRLEGVDGDNQRGAIGATSEQQAAPLNGMLPD